MIHLELKTNSLHERNFQNIKNYIESEEFQKDFPNGYWEQGKNGSGKILTIKGEKTHTFYQDVTIGLRDDEDLNHDVVIENVDKLKEHYKKIIDMILL